MSEKPKFPPTTEYVEGRELMEKYEFSSLDLVQMVLKGLPPYNEPFFDPTESISYDDSVSPKIAAAIQAVMKKDGLTRKMAVKRLEDIRELIIRRKMGDNSIAKELVKTFLFDLAVFERFREKTKEPVVSNQVGDKNKVFPCQPGTKWEDVSIWLTSSEEVEIKTPGGKGKFHRSELGQVYKSNKERPTVLWELLKIFARQKGEIDREAPVYDESLRNSIKRLNYHFQKLFGINESLYVGHYKKEKAYKTRIWFNDRTI